jgi:hypothetical protein
VKWLVAVVAAVVLVPPPPAFPLREWITQPCPSGSIAASVGAGNVLLDGQLDCATIPGLERAGWGIAVFPPGRTSAMVVNLHPYGPVAPTQVHVSGQVRWEGTGYLCLMVSPQQRLACLSATRQPSGAIAVAPVDRDSPPVQRPVSLAGSDNGTNPTCGTCW